MKKVIRTLWWLILGTLTEPLWATVGNEDDSSTYLTLSSNMLREDYQTKLRSHLKQRALSLSDVQKAGHIGDSLPFFLPFSLSSLERQTILEVGPGPGFSLRAFEGHQNCVSIVEPSLDALSMAFDRGWTREVDLQHVEMVAKEGAAIYETMQLDTRWMTQGPLSSEWIWDDVNIYPTTLEQLPSELDHSFSLIAYKDFNIKFEDWEAFFKRLSSLLTDAGIVVFQFRHDDYDWHNAEGLLESELKKYFTLEWILDPREYTRTLPYYDASGKFLREETSTTKNEKRMVILRRI